MSFPMTYICAWCKAQYDTFAGSKFRWRREKGIMYKRRKCPVCVAKETPESND
jgi:DNA-directed RNA polymerase subunit RPC12/RpoP